MDYKVTGIRLRPIKTWRVVVEKDCWVQQLNDEDAVDHCKWKKFIENID